MDLNKFISPEKGQNILDNAIKTFGDDSSGNPRYEYGGGKGKDTNNNKIPETDCSYLVNTALKQSGIDIPYQTTSDLNSVASGKYFGQIKTNNLQPGDLMVFNGHVGIVKDVKYDSQSKQYVGNFFHSEGGRGARKPVVSPFAVAPKSKIKGYHYGTSKNPITKLLRPKKDSASYASKSQSDVRGANKKTFVDPLVLDLDGDGVELVDIDKSNAMFDLDGDGFAKKTGWVGKDDGLLVLDKNNDGMVNDINELFGNKNQSGFAALSIYDTNHDGKIDSFDDVFKNLKVWQDANGDGSTQAEELKALTDYQIAAINLQNQKAATANDDGTRVTDTGSFTREDGTTGTVGDVEFELDRLYTYYNKEVTLDPRIIDLPWIKGYGYMPDLPIAMSIDTALLEQVEKAA